MAQAYVVANGRWLRSFASWSIAVARCIVGITYVAHVGCISLLFDFGTALRYLHTVIGMDHHAAFRWAFDPTLCFQKATHGTFGRQGIAVFHGLRCSIETIYG